ncbi:MAG: class I SAM-dependent methyltransferase family protein [Nitrososphaerota archaeon]
MHKSNLGQANRSSYGLEVDKSDAEKIRKILVNENLLDESLRILKLGQSIVFPVKNIDRVKSLTTNLKFFRIEIFNFPIKQRRPRTLKEALAEILENSKLSLLPSSYDVVGDIAIIQLRPEIESISKDIAVGIMRINPSIKVVLGEKGKISGTYRLPQLVHLAGEERTRTIHKENSCIFELDVSRVYFSPRLSNERRRIYEQVDSDEVVIDMFAGVGPFSIEIAHHRGAKVKAIEINPVAYEFLKHNIQLNRVDRLVEPILGDAASVVLKFKSYADRIIMNYPVGSLDYLEHAVEALKPCGTIHIYGFSESVNQWLRAVSTRLNQLGVDDYRITGKLVREVAPRRYNVVADVKLAFDP